MKVIFPSDPLFKFIRHKFNGYYDQLLNKKMQIWINEQKIEADVSGSAYQYISFVNEEDYIMLAMKYL